MGFPTKLNIYFDLRFRILRNCVFMLLQHWRIRRALPILAMLPLLGSPFPLHPDVQQPEDQHPKSTATETLEYEVEWRLVNAGKAKLSFGPTPAPTGSEPKSGREMKLHLESTGLVSRLFHVSDDYTSEATENNCAASTFMNAHEGSRDRETKVDYDLSAHKAFFHEHDLIKNTTISKEITVPSCPHDIIGGLYQLRNMTLEPGKSVLLPVSDGKKSVELKIECQRREEIKTPLGLRKTLLYEIFAFNDVLYKRPGHIHVWLTDDARRVPVQFEIRMQFTIGTITLRLAKDEIT